MLDNPITYDTTNLAENMVWEERIAKWFNGWKNVFDLKSVGETESLKKIRKFIKRKSSKKTRNGKPIGRLYF